MAAPFNPNLSIPDAVAPDLFTSLPSALEAAQVAQAHAEIIAEAALAAQANAEIIAVAAQAAQASAETIAGALQISELRYRRLFEAARDGILLLDPTTGRITDANPFMAELLGYSHAEFLDKELWEIGLLQDKVTSQEAFRVLQQEGYIRYEDLPLENRRGERREVEFVSNLYRENGHMVIQCNVRDITERKAMEAERTSLSEANRLLLEATSEGIYGVDGGGLLTFVNPAAARMLGYAPEEMLGRDGHALFHHSYLDGTHYPVTECPTYQSLRTGEGTRRESDVFWRRDGTSLPVAFGTAPILVRGAVTGAVIAFSDITERKAVEAERAQIARREHTIALQLQEALQPKLPMTVPGLVLKRYYEAALTKEAGVGGDFYDVFPIEQDCTALVVGDVSGKGLAAAAQVATVRNMLRAFLYSKPTLVQAITALNRVLAENTLLTGFSTLFVGAYDAALHTLCYVNCGQEPALVRRALTGAVEQLLPTGPVLGALEEARFSEETVTLRAGDALAIFTDGVTDAGTSRQAMLEIAGVTALFAGGRPVEEKPSGAAELAEEMVGRLIAGVKAAGTDGVLHDDVCLLVAVVEGSAEGQP